MAMHKPDLRGANKKEATVPQRPAAAAAPHRLRLSTHSLRERDRFEVFRENFSRYLYPANAVGKAHSTAASSCSGPEALASRGSSRRRRPTRERAATSPI